MNTLFSLENALDVVVSVEPSKASVLQANIVAFTLGKLKENNFKLDLTNNGEFTHAYVENDWGNALLHLKSSHKATIVVLDQIGNSLRLYFEYDATGSILVDTTSNAIYLVEMALELIKLAYEKTHAPCFFK